MTCAGGYVDEWSLMPESFHEQLLGRCSLDGAQLFGNTNPDNPRHWLKKNYLDELGEGQRHHGDWKRWKFLIDDNPSLSEKVKARYRRQYKGLWYRRMILGEWCLAEGAVYEVFDYERHVVEDLPDIAEYVAIGVDYGTTNPFAALVLAIGLDGCLYFTNEWRWDSKKRQRSLTDGEYSAYLRQWVSDLGIQPKWWVVDRSAKSFKTQLFRDGVLPTSSLPDVMDGIRLLATLMAEGRIKFHASCVGFLNEVVGYSWDEKKVIDRGEDVPIKLDDHSLDAARYAVHTTQQLWRPYVRTAALMETWDE
jgi:PBSX family phage terminase large subunit